MKKLLILVFAFLILTNLYSQNSKAVSSIIDPSGYHPGASNSSSTSQDNPDPKSATLRGKITDKNTGEPLIGAAIYIPELKRGTITDLDGNYIFNNLPAAKLLIQVSYLSYKSIVATLDLTTTNIKDFSLEPAITEIKELVITGTSRSTEIKRSPSPIAIMNRREINQVASTNIIDVITRIPGVNAVTSGPNISKPFIHGLGYNRVLTLVDGIRQEGQQWGDEHGVEVDENAIDNVEVIKGPASLIYGSDALAGVINLIPYPPVAEGELKGSYLGFYQTNNRLIGSSIAIDANSKGLIWGGRLSYKMATNYQDPVDGRVYGTAFRESDASGYIGLNRHWGFSHLNFSVYNDLQMIPDGSRDSLTRKFTKQITEADTFRPIVSDSELNSYSIGVLHQHIQHYKIYSTNKLFIGKSKLDLTFGFQRNIRQEFSHPQAPSISGLSLTLNTLTYDAKYNIPEIKNWEIIFGLNGMLQDNGNDGTEFIIPNYRLFDLGPFLFFKKKMDKFELSGGLRYDNRYFSNDEMFVAVNPLTGFGTQVSSSSTLPKTQPFVNYTHTYNGLSGSIGMSWVLNDALSIKADIARGFRAPNIAEISANGVHPGTNIYQIGNLNFNPEFSLQEDAGLFYSKGHFKGSIELFNTDIYNYIFNQKLTNHFGTDSIIIRGNQTFKYQQSRAHLWGGEISADIHPHPLDWIHFENSVAFVYAVNLGSAGVPVTPEAKYLPLIPPFHWQSDLRTDLFKKSKRLSGFYLMIGLDLYATQNRVYFADNTESITPGYTLFNAGIGSDVINWKKKVICSIHISGNNLFDRDYQSHLSRLKYFEPYPKNPTGRSGIYNMGRNIELKVLFQIG